MVRITRCVVCVVYGIVCVCCGIVYDVGRGVYVTGCVGCLSVLSDVWCELRVVRRVSWCVVHVVCCIVRWLLYTVWYIVLVLCGILCCVMCGMRGGMCIAWCVLYI